MFCHIYVRTPVWRNPKNVRVSQSYKNSRKPTKLCYVYRVFPYSVVAYAIWWHCCCNFAVAGSMPIQLIHKAYFVCDSFIFFLFGRTSSSCHWSAQCSDTFWKESRSHHGKWHVYKWSYVYRYCNMSLWHSGRFC